jgi:hypothetical protein
VILCFISLLKCVLTGLFLDGNFQILNTDAVTFGAQNLLFGRLGLAGLGGTCWWVQVWLGGLGWLGWLAMGWLGWLAGWLAALAGNGLGTRRLTKYTSFPFGEGGNCIFTDSTQISQNFKYFHTFHRLL